MKFSLISPTFKRPDEVIEFLDSLLQQNYSDFEVILGDGTPGNTLRPLLKRFENNSVYKLTIVYEEFLPVSEARNLAAKSANGTYLIFFDSDCIIPPNYLNEVADFLKREALDAFGGPDVAHPDFTNLQKAISYSMTSMLTTGGIRGKENSVGTYHPRGFNMGVKKKVFDFVGGYSEFRCGEDIELSIRIIEAGYHVALIPQAYVYHKRRTSMKQFFRQVFRFGAARINIWKRHPSELKLTHLFPLVFMLGTATSILAFAIFPRLRLLQVSTGLILLYLLLVGVDSAIKNKSLKVALLSVATTVVMHYGYGWGFLKNWWTWNVLNKQGGLNL